MSARHFLDIDGAATLPTEALGLVDQSVADLVRTQAMGAVHGQAVILGLTLESLCSCR